jgi:RNA polymerase sigma-70 factor (ECF subfamily)
LEYSGVPLSRTEFNRVVSEHGPALYRLAYRMMGDAHEAEDAVQDTFRSAWKSRQAYQVAKSRGGGERAWLASILRRRVVDRWRKKAFPTVTGGELMLDVEGATPDLLAGEFTDEMQAALNRLPTELRESLLLVIVGELTHQEAADQLGVPLGTVLSRVSRARERLREYWLAANKSSTG